MGTDKTESTVIYDTELRSKKKWRQIENEKELNKRYTRLFEIVNSNAELNKNIINEFTCQTWVRKYRTRAGPWNNSTV